MAKLNDRQKAEVVAKYATGGYSYRQLAREYGMSPNAIRAVVCTPANAQLCAEIKKENAMSMQAFLADRRRRAQTLIDAILDMPPELIRRANLRDQMGALKILHDVFLDGADPDTAGDQPVHVTINLADTSGGGGDGG